MERIGMTRSIQLWVIGMALFLASVLCVEGKTYKVQRNDNLTKIAQQFKTTPYAIAKANKISVKSVILADQILTIPEETIDEPERFIKYIVRRGDRLSDIAAKFKVTTSSIASDNNLSNINNIYEGQQLQIRQKSPSSNSQSRIYRVKRGDDLSSVAQSFGTSIKSLVKINNLRNANLIKPGQILRIPSSAPGQYINPAEGLSYDVSSALRNITLKKSKWKRIMIHHTGTTQGTYKGIDAHHRRVGMENGLAYHFLIGNGNGMKNGEIAISRRWSGQLDGGHTQIAYLNATSIGICLVGNFEKSRPTTAQLKQLSSLCRFLMAQCGIPKSAITTHKIAYSTRKGYSTACPGKYFSLSDLKKKI